MLKVGGDGTWAVHPLMRIIPISSRETDNFIFIYFTSIWFSLLSCNNNDFSGEKFTGSSPAKPTKRENLLKP
jgi:hypothetical protein